jgi:hypothetical protein
MRFDNARIPFPRRFQILPKESPCDIFTARPRPGKEEMRPVPDAERQNGLTSAVRVHLTFESASGQFRPGCFDNHGESVHAGGVKKGDAGRRQAGIGNPARLSA